MNHVNRDEKMRKLLILLALSCVWMFSVASSPVVTGAKVRINAKKYSEAIEVLEENKGKYLDDPELFLLSGSRLCWSCQLGTGRHQFFQGVGI